MADYYTVFVVLKVLLCYVCRTYVQASRVAPHKDLNVAGAVAAVQIHVCRRSGEAGLPLPDLVDPHCTQLPLREPGKPPDTTAFSIELRT